MRYKDRQPRNRCRRVGFERLERRRLLATFELASLLPQNGGDGSEGFMAFAPVERFADFEAVSLGGDVNDDGFDDLIIGRDVATYVVYGSSEGFPPVLDATTLDGERGFAIRNSAGARFLGFNIASNGDLNGDGIDDLVLYDRHSDASEPAGGSDRLYVLFGRPESDPFPAEVDVASLSPSAGGDGTRGFVILPDELVYGLSVGDITGDGIGELILGMPSADANGLQEAGQTVVIFGKNTDANGDGISDRAFPYAEIAVSEIAAGNGSDGFVINGAGAVDWSGWWISAGGDVDGDGVGDLAISAIRFDGDRGRVFVLFGGQSFGSTLELTSLMDAQGDASKGFVVNGTASGTITGRSVDLTGDVNGDGFADLLIGVPWIPRSSPGTQPGEPGPGAAYVVFGRDTLPRELNLESLSPADGFSILGKTSEDESGRADQLGRFASVGDLNGDQLDDLILSTYGDPGGRVDAGSIYVVFGTESPSQVIDLATASDDDGVLVINGVSADDRVGMDSGSALRSLLDTGDMNGDGVDDLATFSWRAESPTVHDSRGEAYIVLGKPAAPPLPSLSINDISVTEGDSGAVTARFTVTRSGDLSRPAAVDGSTENGTAVAGEDYEPVSNAKLAFAPGVSTLAVEVVIRADVRFEPDETFFVNLSNPAGATIVDGQGRGTIVNDDPPVLTVTSFLPTDSGFVAEFSHPLDVSDLNLDERQSDELGPPDVLVEGASEGVIRGSLAVNESAQRVSFLKSGGPLAADTYTVRLRSAANGFESQEGYLLDGDGDGLRGDDLVSTFTVQAPPAEARTVSLPDIVRGPGQPVNLPANSTAGLPLSISDGADVRAIDVRLSYDPTLLEITSARVGPEMPSGATVILNNNTPGLAILVFFSPTGLPAGESTFVNLEARVPSTDAAAIYNRHQMLDIHNVTVSDGSDNEFPVVVDDPLQVASYFGDVSGNRRINASDAARVASFAALLETSFAASALVDPVTLGDVSGNGRVNAADASLIARFAALISVPEIPPLPAGTLASGLSAAAWRATPDRHAEQAGDHTYFPPDDMVAVSWGSFGIPLEQSGNELVVDETSAAMDRGEDSAGSEDPAGLADALDELFAGLDQLP